MITSQHNKKRKAETISAFTFMQMFPTEDKSVAFVEKILWEGKPACPHCQAQSAYRIKSIRGWRCNKCRKNFSVRVGTIFESSRMPLQKWLFGIYILQTARKGVSSMQLSKELSIQQRSAWFMLHRLRESCGDNLTAEKLDGIVEVDETYLGGKESNKHANKKLNAGTGVVGKTAVIGARKRGGKTTAKVLPNTKREALHGFIQETIESGSEVITDEHPGYKHLCGYMHDSVKHSAKEFVNGMAHTNSIESVWALLKRGFNGVYHHWSLKHTQKYINEFAFRLNEGNCEVDTLERIAAVIRGSAGKRLTYKELTEEV